MTKKIALILIVLGISFLILSCNDCPTCCDCDEDERSYDLKLNGKWENGNQTPTTINNITELRFDNGDFEWTWEDDLQARGVYDTKEGVLTVTIEHRYGSKSLSDYSRKYSIANDTLTWGGEKFWRKK
ncbi:MAG: hypothetical protein HQK83_04635 [Fibrobacteria bacterium]|nr:hypothetical protein [Fibrobacteria bacterium]